MSLNYDLSQIKDWETKCRIKTESGFTQNPITYALIWLSLSCGYGEITEKNAKTVFKRIYAYERARGAMNNKWEGVLHVPSYIEYAQVVEHIGLRLNVSWWTDAQFKKELAERVTREPFYEAGKEIERHEAKQDGA